VKPASLHSGSKLVIAAILGAAALGTVERVAPSYAHIPTATAAPAAVAPTSTPALDTVALVAKVRASVVNITVEQSVKGFDDSDSPLEFFRRHVPSRPGAPSPELKRHALGSGFIFDDKGHVLTNAHVIDGADKVKVKLSDERELEARVKGKDERLDVAVLEIVGAKDLPYVVLGSSDATQVGENVVAIGNPLGLGNTVTKGIVSAKGRAIGAGPYDDFLQTDASINPGNSGGPLFDAHGQVIGMNTAIAASAQGIGFAIPSDEIREVLPQLVSSGHVARGRLGVSIQEMDEKIAAAKGLSSTRGALVANIERGGPADQAGLVSGDVITRVDGTDIAHARELTRAVARHAPGSKVSVVVHRDGRDITVPVTLAKLEDENAVRRVR
jgi:serine protease Do